MPTYYHGGKLYRTNSSRPPTLEQMKYLDMGKLGREADDHGRGIEREHLLAKYPNRKELSGMTLEEMRKFDRQFIVRAKSRSAQN